MVTAITAIIIVTLLETSFYFERRDWAAERQKLLDRVQSASLADYKISQNMDKPKDKKEPAKGVEFL